MTTPINPYLEEIREWDWDGIQADALENEGQVWLGSIYSLTPSGKFYTAWVTGDLTEKEADMDEMWWDALETVAEEYGMSVSSGEYEPDHVYAFTDVEETEDGL